MVLQNYLNSELTAVVVKMYIGRCGGMMGINSVLYGSYCVLMGFAEYLVVVAVVEV